MYGETYSLLDLLLSLVSGALLLSKSSFEIFEKHLILFLDSLLVVFAGSLVLGNEALEVRPLFEVLPDLIRPPDLCGNPDVGFGGRGFAAAVLLVIRLLAGLAGAGNRRLGSGLLVVVTDIVSA